MSGYGVAAHSYLAAGWGPLPVPHGQKGAPPRGWTGYDVPMPTYVDVQTWVDADPGANIAVRLPADVIGIDFDAYKEIAQATMARLIGSLGALPQTWRSSSKTDGSGIYFYRLPRPTSPLGDVGPGVETIRHEHRYAVVQPSTHPSGEVYRWTTPEGGPGAPKVDDLPMLPEPWVAHLEAQRKLKTTVVAATSTVAYDGLEAAERARIDHLVSVRVDAIVADLRESAGWAVGQTDSHGRGWEKLQADKAWRLASLALADWNALTMEQAQAAFVAAAPTGAGWGDFDVTKKWDQQAARAQAAPFPPAPVDFTTTPGLQPPTTGLVQAGGAPPAVSTPGGPAAPAPGTLRPWDDRGNAERDAAAWGPRLVYLTDTGSWAYWQGGRWQLGTPETGARAVQSVLRDAPDRERQAHLDAGWSLADYAKKTAAARTSRAVGTAATWLRNTGELDARLVDFDTSPSLLQTGSGVVDLVTGAVLDPDPSLRLLRGTAVPYDPTASAPEFLGWLEWAQPDPAMREYLQLVAGTTLTGEQVKRYWVHEGPSGGGKSMFLEILMGMLGDLATVISANLITGRDGIYGDDYARASLRGARLAALDETKAGGHSFDASIKQLVGGAAITGRNPTERPFTFRPVFKLHIATNSAPANAPDEAIASRLEIIRWDRASTPEQRYAAAARLGSDLKTYIPRHELPGVLAWAVRGAQAFYATGGVLRTPATVRAATDEHMAEGDLVAQWLAEETVDAPEGSFSSSQGWTHFKLWQERAGERVYSTHKAWGARMADIVDGDPTISRGKSHGVTLFRGRAIKLLQLHQ